MTLSSGGRFTYRDELALTTYLVDELERRLAGRHERRVLTTLPTDHCHLGVLGPRDPDVEQPDPLEETEELEGNEGQADARVGGVSQTSREHGDTQDDEDEEPDPNAEQASAERRGENRDSTRRPPSSLGFELVLEPTVPGGAVELEVEAKFVVYTRHFPTFEEQLGSLGDSAYGTGGRGAPRDRVSLAEAHVRREVEVPPITLRVDLARPSGRLTDGGAVQRALDDVLDSTMAEADIRREISGNATVPVRDLDAPASFERYLRSIVTGPPLRPPLRSSLDARTYPMPDGKVRLHCYLKNDTPRDVQHRYMDQYHILADARLEARLAGSRLCPVELVPVPEDYQYDRRVWAVGHSASAVVSEDHESVRTEALARYAQPRRTTSEEPAARFESFVSEPLETLEDIRQAMVAYAEDWQGKIDRNELSLSPEELEECAGDLEAFRDEEARFAAGVAALAADDRLMRAFVGMNRVFGRVSGGRYDRWRLFQIAFIVTQLPALAVREGVTEGEWPAGTQRSWEEALDWADVLWFPTGGGKTEAYLGLISCAALYDRLRGKRAGVTAWLRFPLRMLSVQQLQRAARTLWETEQERRFMLGEASDDSDPIALGYFVGQSSTPNTLRSDDTGPWSFARLESDPDLRRRLLLISDCPACGEIGTVGIETDRAVQRIRHVCGSCRQELPVYVSDAEVYRFLPTVVIGTVDKMASVAWNPKFSMLWGGAAWRCPEYEEHGYGLGDWCVSGCPTNPGQSRRVRNRTTVAHYDPAPCLHVQDEMHLLQEELGAFAGHYETLIRSCEEEVGGLPPKTVAATATVEGFEHQLRHIYGVRGTRRFPGRGYDRLETFYAAADLDPEDPSGNPKTARLYVAFRPPHLHAADAASLCVRILHQELNRLHENPYEAAAWLPTARTEEEVRALLHYYVTTLTYVGSRNRGLRVRQALDRAASSLRPASTRDLSTTFLSSDSTLAEIADTVRRIESPPEWGEEGHLDATVATSLISHGVDVERFNLMIMDGIPEETADYIQASSRSGRRHVGLVIAVLASYSLRSSSIYHRFQEYHAHLERLVSPVPVNRFAKYAARRTAPGVLVGLVLGRYGALAKRGGFNKRAQAAALFSTSLRASNLPFRVGRDEFVQAAKKAYALGRGVYPEGLELQMRQVVEEEADGFLYGLAGSREEWLNNAVRPTPMSSLRDVDVGVRFRPSETSDWEELRYFRRS